MAWIRTSTYLWETNPAGLLHEHPYASHTQFPYFFTDNDNSITGGYHGIYFGGLPPPFRYLYDLAIYYDDLDTDEFLDCRCSRWDVDNYSVVVETWLKKTDVQALRNYTTPGAVGELFKIIDRPVYYDKTWEGLNTLRLFPTPSSQHMSHSNLLNMRNNTLIYVKNVTTSPVPNSDWSYVKIEGFQSGSGVIL